MVKCADGRFQFGRCRRSKTNEKIWEERYARQLNAQWRHDAPPAFDSAICARQPERPSPRRISATPKPPTTTTWKVQTSWPAGVGLNTFKTWCNSIKEKTGGELEFKPFAAKEIVGDFELLDGVKNGVLEAMNSFCVYWVGKIPATAFLSSYLMGLRYPHEWDIFFYGKDGVKMAREIYAKQGLFWVGRIHHGPNIIHSKKPIRSIEDFKDLKLRVPGGMIAEGFAAAGAQHHAAAGRRGVLGAGEGHRRCRRLYRSGGELGSRLPAGHQVHLDRARRAWS